MVKPKRTTGPNRSDGSWFTRLFCGSWGTCHILGAHPRIPCYLHVHQLMSAQYINQAALHSCSHLRCNHSSSLFDKSRMGEPLWEALRIRAWLSANYLDGTCRIEAGPDLDCLAVNAANIDISPYFFRVMP